MTDRETMRLALEALESAANNECNFYDYKYAAKSLRQALEQPRQECETCANKRRRLEQAGFLKSPLRGEETRPQQNPVAYLYHDTVSAEFANPLADSTLLVLACNRKPNGRNETPLYTAPPKREWVGLTDEEIDYIWGITKPDYEDLFDFPRAIEAKLRAKNGF